jgi:GNAT superfamily N-acetyltransferase
MSPDVRPVTTDEELRACWPVLAELRPHLDETDFLRRFRIQSGEGYRLVSTGDGDRILGVAGYRVLHTLAWGRVLYLDDLVVTGPEHGRGIGSRLLRHVQAEAARLGCDEVHLDTGYQRHRAHRSYLRHGFDLIAHHLAWRPESS